MSHISLAQRIIASKTPFVFFQTDTVTKELLQQAIAEEKSMDFDVCVDDAGSPYLGHSREYHEKSGEPWFDSMPLWEARIRGAVCARQSGDYFDTPELHYARGCLSLNAEKGSEGELR